MQSRQTRRSRGSSPPQAEAPPSESGLNAPATLWRDSTVTQEELRYVRRLDELMTEWAKVTDTMERLTLANDRALIEIADWLCEERMARILARLQFGADVEPGAIKARVLALHGGLSYEAKLAVSGGKAPRWRPSERVEAEDMRRLTDIAELVVGLPRDAQDRLLQSLKEENGIFDTEIKEERCKGK